MLEESFKKTDTANQEELCWHSDEISILCACFLEVVRQPGMMLLHACDLSTQMEVGGSGVQSHPLL